jgi:hypothetical protein
MPDINLSPLTAEQSAIDRRRRMAEAMQQQAILPIDMPNVAGAKVSPYQGLAKLLQGYIAGKSLEKADIEQQKQQSDYLSDVGYILQNIGKNTEGSPEIPEKTETIRTPIAANQNLQELALRQTLLRDPNAAISPFEKKIDRSQLEEIAKLPLESFEEKVTPRVPAVPPRPILSTDLLMGNNAKGILSGGTAGKLALAQALMQQKTLEQAAALKKQEAASAIQSVAPGAALFQGGKVIYTNPKDSPPREIKTNDPLTGMPITKYVPENVLVTLGNIPDQYKGFAADLITAQNLPKSITTNPQLLNLIGSQLNKQAGQVTESDVANYMLRVAETRARLGYDGIKFDAPNGLTAAPNPLIKPVQKTTTQAEIAEVAKKSGKTIEQVTQDAIAKGYKVQ